ncbi:MAG TPA: hypothetical protein PLC40_10200, partial [Candidatus Hydrogenedentes bacterium]|nr:hypothetical protein [Candidatus Hydrogenedentota bacterium]
MHTRPTALMKDVVSVLFLFFLVLTGIPHMSRDVFAQEPIELESDSFSLHVSANGLVAGLVDHVTGTNYINRESPTSFAVLKGASRACYSKAARYDGKQLVIDFEEPAGQVAFTVTAERRRLVFEVASLTWSDAEELVFAGMPLALKGDLAEPFGVSPLALNLQTNCHTIPGLNSSLSGFMAYRHFGIVGARGAIIACPVNEMRDALKEAVKSSPGLVCSSLGGPWALDAEINQGSYLIASEEDVTEANVDKWIEAARQAGATQIDLHGGHPFRWGDYEVNREVYPRGRDSLKAVADAIHEAGLCVGLHSYAFFIAKETPWVTPVPDPRLDYDATFTLAGDLSDTDAVIPVMESTEAMSTVTGFQVRNSVTLWIDDELILYADIGKDSPYEFRQCIRGAHGTRPAAHAKNAPIRHLKECFGLFVPRGDSTLYTEVAQRTAELYNYCGFDMLYLDALDGAGILAGGGNAWHYEAKFVHELMNRLDRPPVMEMSTFSHHLWCARSRMQAWDCPSRAVKDLVDCHVLGNLQWKAAFLPTHLGWWGNFGWDGIHPERTMPDDMEYLCAKALATDSSLSYIVGFGPESLKHETVQRLAGIARRYEKLRLAGAVPDSVKERLAARGAEFTLSAEGDEPCRFR